MKFKKAEKIRLKTMASYAKERTLDVGFSEKPNPYLNNPDGFDTNIKKNKPKNYNKIWRKMEHIPTSYYNTVLAGEVIEHLKNLGIFLDQCNRVLKNNGLFIFSTENPLFLFNLIGEFTLYKIKLDTNSEHIALYSIKRLIFQLNMHGFRLQSAIGCGFELPFIDCTLQCKHPLLSKRTIYLAKKIKR